MSLVTRSTADGLILAELAQDGASVDRALKEIDPDYLLWPPDAMSPYWRVLCRVSDWQPAITIVTWQGPNGEPLPLSSGIVEEVKKWRPEARSRRGPGVDEHNARVQAEARRLRENHLQALHDDYEAHLERSRTVVHVGEGEGRRSYLRNRHLRKG